MGIKNEFKKFAKKIDYAFSDEEERTKICFNHFVKNDISICNISEKKQICHSPDIEIDGLSSKAALGGNAKFTAHCLKEFRNNGYTDCDSLKEKLFYEVKHDDTIWGIAKNYGVSVDTILSIRENQNLLNSRYTNDEGVDIIKISPNQKIYVELINYQSCQLFPKTLECLGELTKANKQICINGNAVKANDIGEINVPSDSENPSFLLDCYAAIKDTYSNANFCIDNHSEL